MTASDGKIIKASVSEYKGTKRLDVRQWFTGKDGELYPTKQGFQIPPSDHGQLIAEILRAVGVADAE